MVDEKAMVVKCREFLDGQKIQNKVVTPPDIIFKIGEHTFVMNPFHPSGHPILGKKVLLNVSSQKEFNELWAKANARFAMDINYDEWFGSSLAGHHIQTSQPPSQAWLFYSFDSESDLSAMLGQPETFKDYCEKLRIFAEYMTTEDKKV